MLLVRSDEYAANWSRLWRQPQSAVVSLAQIWGLASGWYSEDRRNPDWRRKTPDRAQAFLSSLGLMAPFWSLT